MAGTWAIASRRILLTEAASMSGKATTFLLAAVLAVCGCGPVGGPADPKHPLAGTTWIVEEAGWNGETKKPEKPEKVIFDAATNQINMPEGFMGNYTMDAAATPKTISIRLVFPRHMEGQAAVGIWERNGDVLKLAYTTGPDVPKDFQSRAGDVTTIYTLKRAK
jgi:uncharacterized protein (TIGR03067 family)